ncbi:Crp/Fnr family transcriptional regulator [Beijerinckia sp. L45]|uniref:Crp/Fnr family transcriptional regulator n=1 Tax=Beijerinckia sp. L45 TaxID=1641855 RepID=UPI00131D7DB5|nr:Crp/Fnr family transcriptional regulator [Beijerinckia sp. L45]
MTSAFVRGVGRYATLDAADIAVIESQLEPQVRRYDAGHDIIRQGDKPLHPYLILDGWAYCYKTLPNRRRQIVSFLLPGDVSDLNIGSLRRMDHSIASLTAVTVLELTHPLTSGTHPGIAKALSVRTLASAAIQREWMVNLGQRSAPERIGHILCELFHRLRAVGLTSGNQCFLPLTQTDLAETTGLSLVHVNKRLRDLRSADLLILRGKILTLPNLRALEAASLFNPDYLNLVDVADIVAA